ncbi:MAG: DUF5050 domain-containing protein [Lachnospiraceae bacterium]|nr:DUF5050 domain-containing protein [Lachnospiraceae bacterium]
MSSRKSTIIALLVVALVLILISIITFFPNKMASNPADTVGNSAGNLNNKGLYCEKDGTVYFANAYDNGSLYSMNVDTSDMKKLSDAQVEFICVGGKFLYYYQTTSSSSSGLGSLRSMHGVYRASVKGGHSICIDKSPVAAMNLIGDYLYYQHYDVKTNTTFYRVKTDKSNKLKLTDELINPACAINGTIYYNGVSKDHYLYSYDTASDTSSLIWDYDIWNPIVEGNMVYYMDVHNNYALCSYDMNTQQATTLTTDRIDYFNVINNVIFYQVSSETAPALMRMNTDGTNIELVAEGVFEGINVTSQYTYFNEYGSTVPVYMTSTYGDINVTTFDAAKDAALQNSK